MMISLTLVSPTAGPAHLGESHPPPLATMLVGFGEGGNILRGEKTGARNASR